MNTATIQQQTSPLEALMKESLIQAFKELKEGQARPIDELLDEL